VNLNKTNLKKILAESHFDPNEPGRFAAILEDANPEYLVNRAMEMLREAKCLEDQMTVSARLRDAISLLAAARVLCGSDSR
jgi:hypothetical protein